jgi:uncharacterized membrane protein YhaH (DUF805 family)
MDEGPRRCWRDTGVGDYNMRDKKARAYWIGIVVFYAVSVSTVMILDLSLHWGLIVGLKILAGIHILLVLGIVLPLGAKRKRD